MNNLRHFKNKTLPNAVLMLAHRLRRWPSINPALVQRLVWVHLSFRFICPLTRVHRLSSSL